jgi:hypothetical protein
LSVLPFSEDRTHAVQPAGPRVSDLYLLSLPPELVAAKNPAGVSEMRLNALAKTFCREWRPSSLGQLYMQRLQLWLEGEDAATSKSRLANLRLLRHIPRQLEEGALNDEMIGEIV